jgi:AGZA family xanthine/uracil permease-like MFS transporter
MGIEPVRARARGLSLKGVGDAFANFGFSVPLPAFGHVFSGFEFLGIILVTAIRSASTTSSRPWTMSRARKPPATNTRPRGCLTADGVVSLIGCLMGNPFINAVYIGHPGWKAMGGRIGYSAATGVMVVLLSWFGIISVLLALVPVVAISPILLYIGMLIGAQAFQTTPVKHCARDRAGADAASGCLGEICRSIPCWASTMTAAQTVGGLAADKVGCGEGAAIASLPQQGVIYHGLEVMGGGSILCRA